MVRLPDDEILSASRAASRRRAVAPLAARDRA
jgi:hypothetical protein